MFPAVFNLRGHFHNIQRQMIMIMMVMKMIIVVVMIRMMVVVVLMKMVVVVVMKMMVVMFVAMSTVRGQFHNLPDKADHPISIMVYLSMHQWSIDN